MSIDIDPDTTDRATRLLADADAARSSSLARTADNAGLHALPSTGHRLGCRDSGTSGTVWADTDRWVIWSAHARRWAGMGEQVQTYERECGRRGGRVAGSFIPLTATPFRPWESEQP